MAYLGSLLLLLLLPFLLPSSILEQCRRPARTPRMGRSFGTGRTCHLIELQLCSSAALHFAYLSDLLPGYPVTVVQVVVRLLINKEGLDPAQHGHELVVVVRSGSPITKRHCNN